MYPIHESEILADSFNDDVALFYREDIPPRVRGWYCAHPWGVARRFIRQARRVSRRIMFLHTLTYVYRNLDSRVMISQPPHWHTTLEPNFSPGFTRLLVRLSSRENAIVLCVVVPGSTKFLVGQRRRDSAGKVWVKRSYRVGSFCLTEVEAYWKMIVNR